VRYSDFTTVTRSHSLASHIADPDVIARVACDLLARTEANVRPVRLLGVSLHNLRGTTTVEATALPFE